MFHALFNKKSRIAATLALSVASGTALAAEPASTPDAGITVHIHQGFRREGIGLSQRVNGIQGCYNALSAATASESADDSTSMMCLDGNGALLASAVCESQEVGWGGSWKSVCRDTTAETRQKMFPLSQSLLQAGPVNGPTR